MDQEFKFFNQVKSQAAEVASNSSQGGTGGTLPIRIKIPQIGKVFRFTKQVIVDRTPLELSVVYIHHAFIQFVFLALWFALLGFIVKRRTQVKGYILDVKLWLGKNKSILDHAKSPLGLTIITFVTMYMVRWVIPPLRFLFELLFVVAVIRLVVVLVVKYIKKKKKRRGIPVGFRVLKLSGEKILNASHPIGIYQNPLNNS
jgi:hypothetical protein